MEIVKTYNKNNFHKYTFCQWNEVLPDEVKSLKKSHNSKSGSEYFFTEKGVYRVSNHWGRVANCRWRLLPIEKYKNQQTKIGFAEWNDFYPNDDTSNLYFIKVDFNTNDVNYYHKLSREYDGTAIVRNAQETAKTIKIIRDILADTNWAKYLNFDDLQSLRTEIVSELITSERSFLEIRKRYL